MAFTEDIKLIILFGSRAAGKTGAQSDTDIAALADHPLTIEEKGRIAEEAGRLLGISEDTIDTIDIWHAPPLLQQEIAQNGKLLHGDAFDFIRFRVLAWKRYLDTAKFRRARERALAQHYGK
ncbi:MAG: nucleotidyltransferase domain-containing protein [Candidatus Sungiibacteriota bacterium]